MIAPIVILLILAAAPFVFVAIDMRRHELARRQEAAAQRSGAATLVIEHVDAPRDARVLAA